MIEAGVVMRDLAWRTRSGRSGRSATISPAVEPSGCATGVMLSALEIQREYLERPELPSP
jgi:hypothetical protein